MEIYFASLSVAIGVRFDLWVLSANDVVLAFDQKISELDFYIDEGDIKGK